MTGPELTILSDNGKVRAKVREVSDGLEITFWRQLKCDGAVMWKLTGTQVVVDAPYHLVRDTVHTIVHRIANLQEEKET